MDRGRTDRQEVPYGQRTDRQTRSSIWTEDGQTDKTKLIIAL